MYCETVPWRTVDEFNEYRSLFEEWRRSRVLKTLGDWHDWEGYVAGTEASRAGVRRRRNGVQGQAIALILKAFALRKWGFKNGRTYKAFADHLTAHGYPTTGTEIKNAKRAKFDLAKQVIPGDAPGIAEIVQTVLAFEPDFEWKALVSGEVQKTGPMPHVLVA